MQTISIDILNEYLSYNPGTGIISWIKSPCSKRSAGDQAGRVVINKKKKYIRIKIKGCEIMAHRVAWAIYTGAMPTDKIDHIDGNGINNRIDNLREADNFINAQNQKIRDDNSSGFCGVSWNKHANKWSSEIHFMKRKIHLGYFSEKHEAITARKNANIKYGFHENHGLLRL